MSDAGIAFVVLLFGIGVPFVIYLLVQAERSRTETMTRGDAERVARRDTDDEERG